MGVRQEKERGRWREKKRERERNRGEGGGGKETNRLETEAVFPDEQTRSRSEHPDYVLRHIISNIPIPQGDLLSGMTSLRAVKG